jgi:hypothetical protein
MRWPKKRAPPSARCARRQRQAQEDVNGHEISEDDEKRALDDIQKLTDKHIDDVAERPEARTRHHGRVTMSVVVIIPAAGTGSRFGGPLPGQFQNLAGKPLVQHVIERFLLDENVLRIVVPVAEKLLAHVKNTERVSYVAGGDAPAVGDARSRRSRRGGADRGARRRAPAVQLRDLSCSDRRRA